MSSEQQHWYGGQQPPAPYGQSPTGDPAQPAATQAQPAGPYPPPPGSPQAPAYPQSSDAPPGYPPPGHPQPVPPQPTQPTSTQPAYPPPNNPQTGYPQPGPPPPGYPQPGGQQPGPQRYPQPGHPQPGQPQPGYPGYPQPGYAQPGYPQPGYAQPGYAQPGYAQPGYAQPGYPQPAYPQQPGAYPTYPLGAPYGYQPAPPVPLGPPKSPWRWVRLIAAVFVLVAIVAGGIVAMQAIPEPPVARVSLSLIANVEQIREVAKKQADALVADNKDGWLAPVEERLRPRFQERYDALRSLKVTSLVETIFTNPSDEDDDLATLHTRIRYGFCAQLDPCPTGPTRASRDFPATEGFLADVVWERRVDGYVITDYDPTTDRNVYVDLPWLATKLTMTTGPKVTVFSLPSENPDLVKSVQDEAESAAVNADKYATDKVPQRYIVYIAGPSQWRTWFGGQSTDTDVLGYAISTSQSSEAVVLNRDNIRTNEMRTVLRHEFGHVSTLLGAERSGGEIGHFWVEGIAELIAQDGNPVSAYVSFAYARGYVRSGQFAGDLDKIESYWNTDDIGVVYTMGYLTWQCIADKYGHEKVVALAKSMFRGPAKTVDESMREALGTPWSEIETDCVAYIRKVAG